MSELDILGFSVSTLFLLVGTLLMIAEAIIPGAHFIVLGVAIFLTGVVGFITGWGIVFLAVTFVLVSILTYVGYSKLDLYQGDGPTTGSSDSDDLVGVEGTVTETVMQGSGKADLEVTGFHSEYQARTPHGEIPEGTRVLVTDGRGGSVVEVQALGPVDKDAIDKELAKQSGEE